MIVLGVIAVSIAMVAVCVGVVACLALVGECVADAVARRLGW